MYRRIANMTYRHFLQ